MIKTKKIKISSKELFNILIKRFVKKRWWLLVWIFLLEIFFIMKDQKTTADIFFIIFFLAYPLFIVIMFWRHAHQKENKLFLAERYYEISEDKMKGILDEDTFSTIKYDHFIMYDIVNNIYLLYLSKNQFIYIPSDSFKSKDDLEWFEKEVLSKIKKK